MKIKFTIEKFVLVFALSIISCSETKLKNNVNSKEKEPIWEKEESETKVVEYKDKPIKYKGFIGNYGVTAELKFDYIENTIIGSYYYNKYKKSIPLIGYIDSPEHTWSNYYVFETDTNGDTTAIWVMDDTGVDYEISGIWEASQKKERLEFRLISDLMTGYLDSNSHILFDSEFKRSDFFNIHHFLHNETIGKQGLILANNETSQYEKPLPLGLKIYEYGVNEGYGIGLVGEIVDGGNIKLNSDEELSFREEFELKLITFVGYEEIAYGFSEIRDDTLIVLPMKDSREICINIYDLENLGYHIEGDGYWLKKQSGNVMGFFPNFMETEVKYEYTHPKVIIYKENNTDSEELLTVEFDKQNGYFNVEDVKSVNRRYWAKIEFDYYTEEPCSGEVYEDQPSIYGWIELYHSHSHFLLKELVLGFYSKGC